MSVRHFLGGDALPHTPDHDRGLAYGDGVFETMRAHGGVVHWWPAHWRRLERGASALALTLPQQARVQREAEALLDGADGVLKLVVTRGVGGRGYAPFDASTPHWILSRHALPPSPPSEGVSLRWCDLRLAVQPALAGIKHCNRLEQVLARAEWRDAAIHEGLMRSTEGDVVGATAANLFVLHDGRWTTPAVDRCGIAGVCREWAIDALQARQARLAVTEVEAAEAVFLCNAVRGILPVARLGARQWRPHPQVAQLRRRLAAEHPAFATEVA
ncbi:aminodeoxychorismate lyase [Lysobacter arvi]|uniref:Aminodeoxychorismate lyase n=1 Tax=Lysobacter arvi TaxID=3038776 RepID=A0ABU1C865_9GAMM|nr:aminodeoxychorismate lyase [Lysobacter arvi]MDR0181377.1 aminodeoxychorismate lyase [Lysobacter arvi]